MAIERTVGKGKSGKDSLKDKIVLIVGSEQYVLETLEELVSIGRISGANRFDQAKEQLENQYLDFAILDVRWVHGYGIQEMVEKKKAPTVMPTDYIVSWHELQVVV